MAHTHSSSTSVRFIKGLSRTTLHSFGCANTRRAFILLLLGVMLWPAMSYAQNKPKEITVILSFTDAFSGEPVDNLTLYVLNPGDSTVIKEVKDSGGDRNGKKTIFAWFDIAVQDSFLLKAESPGYKTFWYHWVLTKRQKASNTFDQNFEMQKERKKKDHTLKGVTVKATKVKFYYKGDTLVYDADAFDLAEGSILDELIRQLPGTELKEGARDLCERPQGGRTAAERQGFLQPRQKIDFGESAIVYGEEHQGV